ncbi:hypothetical protein Vretimale_9557, partial [Volvox reticuliferus]
ANAFSSAATMRRSVPSSRSVAVTSSRSARSRASRCSRDTRKPPGPSLSTAVRPPPRSPPSPATLAQLPCNMPLPGGCSGAAGRPLPTLNSVASIGPGTTGALSY